MQKEGYFAIRFGTALFLTMGGLVAALAVGGRLLLLLGIAIPLLICGLALPIAGYSFSTDGVENWDIYLWKDQDLCEAMEPVFDEMLKAKGYQYGRGTLYSAYKNKHTLEPLGRNYIIRTGAKIPHYMDTKLFLLPENLHVELDFAFRPGSKYVSPYLTIMLRNIQEQNYKFVLGLQKDVVDTLEGLNYRSYFMAG